MGYPPGASAGDGGRRGIAVYCPTDAESPEFYWVHWPVARNFSRPRKPHKCEECRRRIRPGERYERVHGKWDGSVSTIKTCDHCVRMRELAVEKIPCFCWVHGHTREDIQAFCDDETPGFRFAVLRIEADRRKYR